MTSRQDPYCTYYYNLINGTQQAIQLSETNPNYKEILDNSKIITFDSKCVHKSCPISLEPFAYDERIIQLECGHVFSNISLIRWLKHNITCPLCRHKLTKSGNSSQEPNNILNEQANVSTTIDTIIDYLSNILNNDIDGIDEPYSTFEIY